MSTNNLRVIYNNAVDLTDTTITASSTASSATSVANLKLDAKSKVWRSGAYVRANLIVTFATDIIVGGVILPFCNITPTATIRIRGYASTVTLAHDVTTPATPIITVGGTETTPLIDTTAVIAAPYQNTTLWNWGTNPAGANSYAYGGGTYARVWISTPTACRKLTVEIEDTANTSGYLEFSRLLIGNYWSPTYNTSYGLSSAMVDLGKHQRTEAGDLNTTQGVRFNSMKFDLKYMDKTDRSRLLEIIRGNGIARPLFISLFPNNTDDYDKEQQYQIYGKLSQLSAVQHPMYEIYSSQLDIEEI